MRKYFLLSAVALLVTTSANATTDYAEVTARATIEVANTMECSDWNWGTIVVKQKNAEFTIDSDGTTESKDVISYDNGGQDSLVTCTSSNTLLWPDGLALSDITLTSGSNKITIKNVYAYLSFINGTLSIPANVKAGEYTGSFTVTHTY